MTTNNLNKPDLMAEDELTIRDITDYVFMTDMVVGEPYVKLREMIAAYTTNKIIEARMQATLNTAERIKVSFLEHRARTPVQEWKTLEEIIEREKFDILAELKALTKGSMK